MTIEVMASKSQEDRRKMLTKLESQNVFKDKGEGKQRQESENDNEILTETDDKKVIQSRDQREKKSGVGKR